MSDLDFSETLPVVDDYESEVERKPRRRRKHGGAIRKDEHHTYKEDIFPSKYPKTSAPISIPSKDSFRDAMERHERLLHVRSNILGTTVFERNKQKMEDSIRWYGGNRQELENPVIPVRNDFDVIAEENRFVWDKEDEHNMTKEKQMAKTFHDKLYKEYVIINLSRYKTGQFGMRWRTEDEVLVGKGEHQCGSTKCEKREKLQTWEVVFKYKERGRDKSDLVKVRLCPKCSKRLNYRQHHSHGSSSSSSKK
eukprot:m.106696 g.106696  ORF g.106696 m.106696 type:complete len:251 (-) comp12678_c1_seq2:186-938(-)